MLTDDQVEEAAARLARSTKLEVSDGIRETVRNLAHLARVDGSPESVRVFMLWMGDDVKV